MNSIKLTREQDISTYELPDGLKEVMHMSRALGRPLLLAGQPGTGKTQFAHWYASQNTQEFNKEVFQFDTKSSSLFTDLFYNYDAVSHFRNKDEQKDIADFIVLTALGKAIVCAKYAADATAIDGLDVLMQKVLHNSFRDLPLGQLKKHSVVLIDEVDKAPRDFPNDLLNEIENLCFTIREIDATIRLDDAQKQTIVIILTSNDEKSLPDAFLRRCLFFYINFFERSKLEQIIVKKLSVTPAALKDKLDFFYIINDSPEITKKPSTSECIDWINYLKQHDLQQQKVSAKNNSFVHSLSILLKRKDDLDAAMRILARVEVAN